MTLGGPDEQMMFLLLNLEPLLIVVIYYLPDSYLIYVFVALSAQKLQYLLQGNISAGVNCQSLLNGSVPEYPGHRFGNEGVLVSTLISIFSSSSHVEY
jgi:hypothetical protein